MGDFMRHFLEKYIDPWLPRHAILPLFTCFFLNSLVYYGTMAVSHLHTGFYNFTTVLDNWIPVFPPSIFIYGSCYVFWALNYILIARSGRRNLFTLTSSDILAKLVCLSIFIFIPTTNVRPILTGSTISEVLLLFVYKMDQPVNLLPSIHCLTSWFCFIGVRKNSYIPLWYQVFSGVYAVAICLSTLFTKQHVIVDVIVGISLAEGAYWISRHTALPRIFERTCAKITHVS